MKFAPSFLFKIDKEIVQYKRSGKQTEITQNIQNIIRTFNKKGIFLILEVLEWLHKNIKEKELSVKEKENFS